MKVIINNTEYELLKNYKDAFSEEDVLNKVTDYFFDYDYIVGDISYSKLRLKGFYDSKNKKANKINNYNGLSKYLKVNCAADCKYFVLKKGKKL